MATQADSDAAKELSESAADTLFDDEVLNDENEEGRGEEERVLIDLDGDADQDPIEGKKEEKKKSKKSKKKKSKKSSKHSSHSKVKRKKSKRSLRDDDSEDEFSNVPERGTPRMDSGISGISSMGDSLDEDSDDDVVPDELPDIEDRRKPPGSLSGQLQPMSLAEAISMGLDPSSPAVMKAIAAKNKSENREDSGEGNDGRITPERAASMPLGAVARALAMENSHGSERGFSRRNLFERGNSTRSVDSQDSNGGVGRGGRKKRPGIMARAFSVRSVDSTETSEMSSQRKLEKEMSAVERREKRLMKRELKSLQRYRRRQLEKKIKEEGGPRWNFLLAIVTLVTAGELGMDMGTTILSLVSIMSSFECCNEEIGVSPWLLGTTIPYFMLVITEFVLLGFSIKQARANTAKDKIRFQKIDELDEDQEWFSDEEENESLDEHTGCQKDLGHVVHWVVLANPFLGCLIAWFLLYEVASKKEALVILGLEAGAVTLMFIGCYLKRDKFTFNSLLLHGLPLIPLAAICFMIWYYLREGGVCFKNGNFAFDGCELCGERDPTPAVGNICWNGANPYQGTFCGDTPETRFCYFSYKRRD